MSSYRTRVIRAAAFAVALIPSALPASTITISATSAGNTPLIVGYGIADYMPGSNTQSWWKYSGANGARIWSSPSDVEPSDDISPYGDGVTTQTGFLSRRTALRANPLSSTYINWTKFNDNFQNSTATGNNIMKLDYAANSLTSINNKICVVMQRRIGSWSWPNAPTDNSSTDWKDRWEAWQHWYAQAFYYARYYGVERFQMYNEPDHSSAAPLTQAQWLEQLQFAANAVESAIADVNTLYGKNLTPRMHAAVTSGGPDLGAGEFGTLAIANIHRPLFSTADVAGYDLFKTFDYHKYTTSASSFGSDMTSVATALNTATGAGANYSVAVSEFNVYDNSSWPAGSTADTSDIYTKLSAMNVSAANAATNGSNKELYLFKFGLTGNNNATHYVDNNSSPYNIGGVTKSGQVYHLFAKGFAAKELVTAPTSGDTIVKMAASIDTANANRYFYCANTSTTGAKTLNIDLTAWNIAPGTQIIVEQVSDRYHGDISQMITVPANRQIAVNQDVAGTVLLTIPTNPNLVQRTISASADAQVAPGTNANTNFGASGSMVIRNDGASATGRSAAFVKFDLGKIDPSRIQTAVLKFTGSNPGAGVVIGHLYGLTTDSWSEATINWNNAPNLGTGMGNDNSGTVNEIRDNFVEDINNSANIVGQLTAFGNSDSSMMVDVTSFVKSQVDRISSFMLAREVRFDGDSDAANYFALRSKEYNGGTSAPQILFQLTYINSQWGSSTGGNWSSAPKWTSSVPNQLDATATFGSSISAPAAISVDAPQTVGVINFDNANKYTLTGGSIVTLDTTFGRAEINVLGGNHDITSPVQLNVDTNITVANATSTLKLANLADTTAAVYKLGAGTLDVNRIRAGALNISGGKVAVLSNGAASGVSIINSLAISGDGKLDLKNNALIVKSILANDAARNAAWAQVLSGMNSFDPNGQVSWDGGGIVSSAARSNNVALGVDVFVIGVINNHDLIALNGGPGNEYGPANPWMGSISTIGTNDVLVRYTYSGDTNLDGQVTIDDYNNIDGTFLGLTGNVGWASGDFDFNGIISIDDYNAIDTGYLYQGGQLTQAMISQRLGMFGPAYVADLEAMATLFGSAVPEPACAGLLASAAFALLSRRSRK